MPSPLIHRGLLILGVALACSSVLMYILCTATDFWIMSRETNEDYNSGLWRICSNATGCQNIGRAFDDGVPGYIYFSRAFMITACVVAGLSIMIVVAYARKFSGGKIVLTFGAFIFITGLFVLVAIIAYSVNFIDGLDETSVSHHAGHSTVIGCCSIPMSLAGGSLICLSVLLKPKPTYLPLEGDYGADPS